MYSAYCERRGNRAGQCSSYLQDISPKQSYMDHLKAISYFIPLNHESLYILNSPESLAGRCFEFNEYVPTNNWPIEILLNGFIDAD